MPTLLSITSKCTGRVQRRSRVAHVPCTLLIDFVDCPEYDAVSCISVREEMQTCYQLLRLSCLPSGRLPRILPPPNLAH
jgi:hypothetical protein